MTAYPTEFATDLRFFTAKDDLGERASQAIESLAEHGFVVAAGMHESQIAALSTMASQDHIREFCPKDEKTRFHDRPMIAKWLGKGGGRGMVGIYEVEGVDRQLTALEIQGMNAGDVSMVAYGWSGMEDGQPTTAYRVGARGRQLAYERRFEGGEDRFKLGLPLGEMVIATAVKLYGVKANEISLETWKSNAANDLYDQLGFVEVGQKPDSRPTLHKVGSEINGNKVYRNKEQKGNYVDDVRLFKVLANHPLVDAA